MQKKVRRGGVTALPTTNSLCYCWKCVSLRPGEYEGFCGMCDSGLVSEFLFPGAICRRIYSYFFLWMPRNPSRGGGRGPSSKSPSSQSSPSSWERGKNGESGILSFLLTEISAPAIDQGFRQHSKQNSPKCMYVLLKAIKYWMLFHFEAGQIWQILPLERERTGVPKTNPPFLLATAHRLLINPMGGKGTRRGGGRFRWHRCRYTAMQWR